MKIALVPIDNRPVCYNLPIDIANIDDSLELFLPDKKLLGGLYSSANVDGILHWRKTYKFRTRTGCDNSFTRHNSLWRADFFKKMQKFS